MPPSDRRTDTELVAAANDGDEGGFVALYERYREWVVRLATRFTGNADDALDVLQETFSLVGSALRTAHSRRPFAADRDEAGDDRAG